MTDKAYRIDVHHHIVPKEYVKALDSLGISHALGGPLPHWSVDATLEMMNQNNIKTAMTSISAPGVCFADQHFSGDLARRCNEISARLLNDYPERFGAFASLPMTDIDASMQEIDYAFETLKLDGVVLMTNYKGLYLGDPSYEKIYTELNRRKATVFVHPTDPPNENPMGTVYPNFLIEAPFDTTRAIINLIYNGTLERYPDISFIFSHAGGTVPFLAWRMPLVQLVMPGVLERSPQEAFTYLKRLYYDIALSFTPYSLRSLQELANPSHILFGSDFPFAPEIITNRTVAGVNEYDGFNTRLRHAVEYDNAIKLFPRLRHSRHAKE